MTSHATSLTKSNAIHEDKKTTAWAVGGFIISTCISAVVFITLMNNGRDWARQYRALKLRVEILEKENRQWRRLGPSPHVVQRALDILDENDSVRELYEMGGAYKIEPTTILDCRRVEVPYAVQQWAGL